MSKKVNQPESGARTLSLAISKESHKDSPHQHTKTIKETS